MSILLRQMGKDYMWFDKTHKSLMVQYTQHCFYHAKCFFTFFHFTNIVISSCHCYTLKSLFFPLKSIFFRVDVTYSCYLLVAFISRSSLSYITKWTLDIYLAFLFLLDICLFFEFIVHLLLFTRDICLLQ